VDFKDFPELTFFKGLKFQISDNDRNFRPEYSKENWDDIDVSKGDRRSEYKTCFSNKKHGEICFLTNPVYAKYDIDNANISYEKLLNDYQSKKDSLEDKYIEIKERIALQNIKLNDQRRIELNRRSSDLGTVVENRITRTFQISSFGIWNSDCPRKLPSQAIVKANFVDNEGNELKLKTMYLVLKNRNEVISMTPQMVKEGIRYNPDEDCMLWAVTRDRKNVAIFSAERFNEIKTSYKEFTFEMNLISSEEFVTYSTEKIFSL